jgi:hypothetical protein
VASKEHQACTFRRYVRLIVWCKPWKYLQYSHCQTWIVISYLRQDACARCPSPLTCFLHFPLLSWPSSPSSKSGRLWPLLSRLQMLVADLLPVMQQRVHKIYFARSSHRLHRHKDTRRTGCGCVPRVPAPHTALIQILDRENPAMAILPESPFRPISPLVKPHLLGYSFPKLKIRIHVNTYAFPRHQRSHVATGPCQTLLQG